MSSSPFSPFGSGNTSVRTQGEEKKEEQKQNQSTFGAGIMGGGSGGFTTSGLKIPAPRTQIGAGADIAPTATATHSFSPLIDGGVKASSLPLPKTGPFGGIQHHLLTRTTAPKQQMTTAAEKILGMIYTKLRLKNTSLVRVTKCAQYLNFSDGVKGDLNSSSELMERIETNICRFVL